jgi:cellulose synthase/poly-beta-1,6-N-acetylglucosamine synthase-like glycosyltransferase
MIAAWIGALSCSIWLYLIAARGRFWRVSTTATGLLSQPKSAPRVAVIVPARNEADVIGQAILSLLGQDYAGPLRILVVDDHSSDNTASMVCKFAMQHGERLVLISSAPLPAGWT